MVQDAGLSWYSGSLVLSALPIRDWAARVRGGRIDATALLGIMRKSLGTELDSDS